MNTRTQATLDQLIEMNENEEDLTFQRPRSHSLFNMQYVDPDELFDADSDQADSNQCYHFK